MNDINYFDTEGLTNTSANYTANCCKEYYQNLEAELDNLTLYSTTMKLLGTSEEETISYASDYLLEVPSKLEEIAKCKALIAWLRSAIKKKDTLTKNINNYSFINWINDNHIDLENPICESAMTEEDYLNSLSVKDRNRWLTVEATASTIGQAIHRGGFLSMARKDLANVMQKPIETQVNGRDTIIYKKTPAYSGTEIENIFFTLQNEQREAQAKLNSMKHKMEIAIQEDLAKKREKYQKEMSEYEDKKKVYYIQWQEYIDKERKRIQELKIVIPNNLWDIYNKINNLGKKN